MTDYLKFVVDTVQTLLERQSARLGGRPDGTLCITVTRNSSPTYRTIGGPKGHYYSGVVEELPLELEPYRPAFGAWPVLERLSDATGDLWYRRLVVDTAAAFAQHGFEPRTGLGYLGQEAEFDVLGLRPVAPAFPQPPAGILAVAARSAWPACACLVRLVVELGAAEGRQVTAGHLGTTRRRREAYRKRTGEGLEEF